MHTRASSVLAASALNHAEFTAPSRRGVGEERRREPLGGGKKVGATTRQTLFYSSKYKKEATIPDDPAC